MKSRMSPSLLAVLGAFLFCANFCQAQSSTAFTYQGNLKLDTASVTGLYDFRFGLCTNVTSGAATATVTNLSVSVANGLFTTPVDFGNTFNGTTYWLDIGVRPNNSSNGFTVLAGRQLLTATPYAVLAHNADGVMGVLSNSNLPSSPVFSGAVSAGSFSGNGSRLVGVTATPIGPAGGSLTGVYPNPTLPAITTAGTGQSVTINSNGLVTGIAPLTPAMIPLLSGTNIIGLNSMAYQSTNNPSFAGATNQGDFTIALNTNYGLGYNINIPTQGSLNFFDSGRVIFGIFGNENHTVEPELQFGSQGSFSFTEGLDGYGDSMNHFGGSGPYHGFYFMQYDSDPSALDPIGASHPFGFCYRVWSTNQVIFHYAAFRFEGNGTNDGQGNLLFYDHAAGENQGGFPGYHQGLENYSHVAGGFNGSNIFWGSGTFTNGISRGASASLVSGAVYPVDFSLATPSFLHLTFSTDVTLFATNLNYANSAITKDLFLDCGYNPSATITWPTNWLCESATGASALPTNLPAGIVMHVHLTAECLATTNIYASVLLSPAIRYADTNAVNFWTSAGIADNNIRYAINAFVVGLKNNNLWNQWDCIYPLVGGTPYTCSWNLVNPGLYRINWTIGNSSFDSTGWTADGVASFGDSQFNPTLSASPKYTQDSATMLAYSRTSFPASPSPGYYMGATDGSRAAIAEINPLYVTGDGFNNQNSLGSVPLTVHTAAGVLCLSRVSSNFTFFIASGADGAGTNTTPSTGVPLGSIYLGARDSLGIDNPIAANFGLFMIGSGITLAQYNVLTNLITTFEATLNRQ